MSSSRSTFLSGTIFGIVLGVILGHISIWKDVRTHSAPISQTFPVKELAPNGMSYDLGESSAQYPYYPEEPLKPIHNSNQHDYEEELPADSPLANAIAVETVEVNEVASVVSDQFYTEIEEDPTPGAEEPNPLDIENAAPIETVPSKNQNAVRKAIDDELSTTPKSQRDVWFDSLKDMHVDDATGVIRMWKMIGGPIPGLGEESLILSPSAPPDNSQKSKSAEATPGLKEVLSKAISIHQRNALMVSTLGYIRIVPRFTEEIIDGVPTITGVTEELDFNFGERFVAGTQLDLMIKGAGMFRVQDSKGQDYLTRRGRFSLNKKRQLALIDPEAEYVLQPVITIPESATQISIEADGQVNVNGVSDEEPVSAGSIMLTPTISCNQLSYYQNGLLKVSPDFETVSIAPDSKGHGHLIQGFLEVSNVNLVNENQEIARFKEILGE
ncbi:hypothetical protein [Thalassoglobus sp.]|uniref:hypothetical protein n=1 Tax=Thalassoglobus sp. TaxID=2795869 RepID=UPI003AA9DE11